MNKLDLLKFLDDYNVKDNDFDFYRILDKTDFDELIHIDLKNERYDYIHHTSNKYYSNLYHGDFENLKSFAESGYLHPDDTERYLKDFDLSTIKERLKNADPPGLLKGFYRVKGVDGSYIETKQVVVSGVLFNEDDSSIYIYVYDNATREERFSKQKETRSEITGLYEGLSFFKEIRKRFENLDDSWCFIDIMIRKHSLFSDWYGVDRGNYLLTMEAELLKQYAIDNKGMVGFMGQNEFCMVCPYDKEKIAELYAAVKNLVSTISSIETFIPVFGVAMYDGTCEDIREYYNRAALICELTDYPTEDYIRSYDYRIHEKNQEEYRMIYDFEKALDAGQIDFWIQPQIRLPDHKIVGGEALSRWKRNGEYLAPSVFVPILEKYNLITRLDKNLWENVCASIRYLLDKGVTPVPISVNVSRIDIMTMDVLTYLDGLLKKYDLTPKHLHVEITESAYAENSAHISETIKKIRERGFIVLMDDFGSGYSSLNMLKSMTVDVIKLDAQFLRISRDNEQKGLNIIESVVNMTKSLGMPIIVEGVEIPEQSEYLSDLGCQYMQGYNFYKPMPVDEFMNLISDPEKVDLHGFVLKANQQLHLREFLDDNIYSDAMLNNIIGPVAFYLYKDRNIDIIRYNQQFFELVGIDSSDFSQRISGIQEFIHPHDVEKLFDMLEYAKVHHVLGSKGVVRAFRPDGSTVMMSLQIYYFEQKENGAVFYVSAHDVSQLDFDSNSFPGGYYRCTCDKSFEFLYIS
ncbi:MAG: EAL domain-containing protein, partial [Erysipelotrichaceae bacterium]|nr:EAL domain-containing protein [Erysipelotrichaceae bacterium]